MKLTITLDDDKDKFFALIEGQECVLNLKKTSADVLDYYRTFVPKSLRGRGIAQELVDYALNYAKEHQLKIIPSCPFIRSYIDRHPSWQTIVAR